MQTRQCTTGTFIGPTGCGSHAGTYLAQPIFFYQSCTDSPAHHPLPNGRFPFYFWFVLVVFTISVLFSFWFSPQHGHHSIHTMKDSIRDRPNMGLPIFKGWCLVTITPKMNSVDPEHAGGLILNVCVDFFVVHVSILPLFNSDIFNKFDKTKKKK